MPRHSSRVRAVLATATLEALEPRRFFAAGQLDTTFGGGDGRTLIPSSGTFAQPEAIVRQSDGKLLIVGERLPAGAGTGQTKLNLVRLGADGTVDGTFGAAGVV